MSVQRTKATSRNGSHAHAHAQRPRAAFYDLDGTLADLNLVHAALYILTNVGEWTGRIGYVLSFAANAPRLYLAEQQDRRILNEVLFASLKGVSRDRLVALGEEYCDRVLAKHAYTQAVELVDANRAAGLEPVLVTGSPDFIATPFANRFGIEHCGANRLAMNRGRASGRLLEPIMAGSEKSAWCLNWAEEHGIDLADCWGYADSFYDLPFLAAMGHPVAVNPDRRLRATAMSRHWPIIRFEGTCADQESEEETSEAEA